LEAVFGVGPHTISVPRVRAAADVNPEDFGNAISDALFAKIVAVIRIAVPYTGMIVSTRESEQSRESVLALGISQISGGSSTSVGGYAEKEKPENNTSQFEVSDNRSLGEIVGWLLGLGYVPSFCTACYRQGRTGDRFMAMVKNGQIANICQANSLITLKEYLEDYADANTKTSGEAVIDEQLEHIPSDNIMEKTKAYLQKICDGGRDFRF
jgi:2-iminoacetate synthase